MEQLKGGRRLVLRNKQVVTGKKQTRKQQQNVKNGIKEVGRRDAKGVLVTPVRPTDSAINYR